MPPFSYCATRGAASYLPLSRPIAGDVVVVVATSAEGGDLLAAVGRYDEPSPQLEQVGLAEVTGAAVGVVVADVLDGGSGESFVDGDAVVAVAVDAFVGVGGVVVVVAVVVGELNGDGGGRGDDGDELEHSLIGAECL